MQTNNVFGIYNGLFPDTREADGAPAKGPIVRSQPFQLAADGANDWDSQGGQGSSVNASDAYQTIYIDNSAGANNLTVKCVGTNFTFIAPKGTQGYYPLVCAVGGYQFSISGGTASQVVPIALFNIMLPTFVWTVA